MICFYIRLSLIFNVCLEVFWQELGTSAATVGGAPGNGLQHHRVQVPVSRGRAAAPLAGETMILHGLGEPPYLTLQSAEILR